VKRREGELFNDGGRKGTWRYGRFDELILIVDIFDIFRIFKA
jgi:hypothetical protein